MIKDLVAFIDIQRKKKINITVEDENGDDVALSDILDNILDFMNDRLQSGTVNATATEVMPLISQVMSASLSKAVGHPAIASFILSQHNLRYGILQQMMLSFYLFKFIEKNNLKVISNEEDITDEEIEHLTRLDKAAAIATMGQFMGMSPQDMIKEMLSNGTLTKEDLAKLGITGHDDDTDSGN